MNGTPVLYEQMDVVKEEPPSDVKLEIKEENIPEPFTFIAINQHEDVSTNRVTVKEELVDDSGDLLQEREEDFHNDDTAEEGSGSDDKHTYSCEHCNTEFSTEELPEHHSCPFGTVFKCKFCSKSFAENSLLTEHYSTHSITSKSHECVVCKKSFSHKSNLENHARIHTGEKPFECDVCGKTFRQKSYVSIHKRIHTGEKPFMCRFCNKGFTTGGRRTIHQRTHTGERPFKCDMCEKLFARSGDLATHRRIHTGWKPYKCEICEKVFVSSGDLARHRRRHRVIRVTKLFDQSTINNTG